MQKKAQNVTVKKEAIGMCPVSKGRELSQIFLPVCVSICLFFFVSTPPWLASLPATCWQWAVSSGSRDWSLPDMSLCCRRGGRSPREPSRLCGRWLSKEPNSSVTTRGDNLLPGSSAPEKQLCTGFSRCRLPTVARRV